MGDNFDTSHIYDTCDMIVTWFIVIITIVIMAYGPWLIQLSQSLKVLTLVEAEKHLFFLGMNLEKKNTFIYWKIHGMEALFEGAFFL